MTPIAPAGRPPILTILSKWETTENTSPWLAGIGEFAVGVVSHGVGSAGAAVCFEELLRAGAQRLIRAGSCGGMQDDVIDGHLVIVTGAVRNEGFTSQIVPDGYPALASADVVAALRRASRGAADIHEGLTLTSAVFYSHDILGSDLTLWQKTGVRAVEMECAVLFVLAGLAGRESGAILTVDGKPPGGTG